MKRTLRSIALSLPLAILSLPAQAGPAMFQASFIMHAFGNDVTSGASSPFDTSVFAALPLGRNCETPSASTANGAPNPHYCSPAILQRGAPATGSGTLILGSAEPGTVALEQSAFGITATGFIPNSYHYYLQTHTYATFVNTAATFFAGGGPAAGKGTHIKTGKGHTSGRWVIREGANGFGGALGFLGRYGATDKFVVPGKVGTYEGTASWAMMLDLGRPQYNTPIAYTPMGKVSKWMNPYVATNVWVNNYNSNTTQIQARGTGTLWTTGSVTVYATQGVFTTILHRAGHDITTAGGVRNIQLVTPSLTHWIESGFQDHTGHIGILTLRIVPEAGYVVLLAAGIAALVLLHRASRMR